MNDKIYSKLKAFNSDNVDRPEFHVPMMAIGTILLPLVLLL